MRARISGLWVLLSLSAISCIAFAQQSYVDIERRLSAEQLGEVGLTPGQLELLNRYLRQAQEQAPPVETARYETPQGGEKRDPTALMGFSDRPIRSRSKGDVAGWAPETVFELENGQRWKVLKGSMTLRKPLQAPEVLVVPGVAGRWFLQVHEDMPKARVYRID